MALSGADRQRLIVNAVGDVDTVTGDQLPPYVDNASMYGGTGVLGQSIAALWERNAPKAGVSADLQDLYTKRDAIETVLGALASRGIVQGGDNVTEQQSGWLAELAARRNETQAEIVRLESRAIAGYAPVVGALVTTEPVSPAFPWQPSANDPRILGSPYYPGFGRRWVR